jgi:HEAT repeat protein
MQVNDDSTREAAAEALRRMGSKLAIRPLVQALGDQDKNVRYHAVVGLAEITGDKEHHPNLIDYKTAEPRYLEYWIEWAQTEH